MKICSNCQKSYGTGDATPLKFCSESCKWSYKIQKIFESRPDVMQATMDVLNVMEEEELTPAERKSFLNWIRAEVQ